MEAALSGPARVARVLAGALLGPVGTGSRL
jgi:hypothetical protein